MVPLSKLSDPGELDPGVFFPPRNPVPLGLLKTQRDRTGCCEVDFRFFLAFTDMTTRRPGQVPVTCARTP